MSRGKRRTHDRRRSRKRRNERIVEVASRTSLSENTEELLSFWRSRLNGEQDAAPLTKIHRPPFQHRPPVVAAMTTAPRRLNVVPLEPRRHYDDSETLSGSRSSETTSEDSPFRISDSPVVVFAMATVLFGFVIAAIALVLVRTDQDSEMQTPYKMHAPRIIVQRNLREQAMRRTHAPTRLILTRTSPRSIANKVKKSRRVTAAPTKTSQTQNSTTRTLAAPSGVWRLDYALLGSSTSGGKITEPRPMAQSACSVVLHSYCARIREEFYYLPSANSCVTSLRDGTVLCNHSPNRFASLSSCTQRCVYARKPSERCFHTAMFSQCVSLDVKGSLWFFDGMDCRQWHFPLGACPSTYEGGHVFPNLRGCLIQCTGRNRPVPSCQVPTAGPCEPLRLRYPYFAAITPSSGGRLRCFEASAAALRHHRCPTGSNRFLTLEACRKACHRQEPSPDTPSLFVVPDGPSVEQAPDNLYFPTFGPLADADEVDGAETLKTTSKIPQYGLT